MRIRLGHLIALPRTRKRIVFFFSEPVLKFRISIQRQRKVKASG